MKALLYFCLLLTFMVIGCNTQPKSKQTLQEKQKELDAGKLDEKNIYTAEEIGWTAALPRDWKVMTKRENYLLNQKTKNVFRDDLGTDLSYSGLVNLICIEKDQFNLFVSTIQPFKELTEGDYDQHVMAIQNMMLEFYKAKGVPEEHELGAVRIDGVMFDRFCTKLYTVDKKKIILEQKLFSALINGYVFSMSMNFNNSDDEEALMHLVMNSRFYQKK
jgi:hypothetical protein